MVKDSLLVWTVCMVGGDAHGGVQQYDVLTGKEEGRKYMFYLTTHSTHFIYGYMASDIW